MTRFVHALESKACAYGSTTDFPLSTLPTVKDGKFARLVGMFVRATFQVDQPASGGSTIEWEAFPSILSNVQLVSSYREYGELLPSSISGAMLGLVAGPVCFWGGTLDPLHADDIASSDADYTRQVDVPIPFCDEEYVSPKDFSLPPQGLHGDVLRVTLPASTWPATWSTGAALKSAQTITLQPIAILEVEDEAIIPVVARWRVITRSTDLLDLGDGIYDRVYALSDLFNLPSSNGIDRVTSVSIYRGGAATNINSGDLIRADCLRSFPSSWPIIRGSATSPFTGALADAGMIALPLVAPSSSSEKAKLSHTITGPEPLTIRFTDASTVEVNKILVRELLPNDEARVIQMARDLYGITNPSVQPKRFRPGSAKLSSAKARLLPWSVRL